MRMRAKYKGQRNPGWHPVSLLSLFAIFVSSAIALPNELRAEEPGTVLRGYLQARLSGDVATAKKLWDRRDARRSSAMPS